MEKIIDVWSDNRNADEVINIIHDYGYETSGMIRETIGVYEENVEWTRCKDGELPSMCVSFTHDEDTFIHGVDAIEEKPLFLYKLILIVPEDTEDTTEEEDKGEEKMENVTLNIGMVTRNYMPINVKVAKKIIGLTTDCTISECIGYYKGHEEPSLKVEIYGVSCKRGVDLAREFARDFNQECVACTVRFKTVFVDAMATLEECKAMTEELKNQ